MRLLTGSAEPGPSAELLALQAAIRLKWRDRTSSQSPVAARKIVRAALNHVAPDSDLAKRMARCGERDLAGTRHMCKRPTCPTCARWKGRVYYRKVLRPALMDASRDDIRYLTLLHHVATDLDAGMQRMREREDRSLRHIVKQYPSVRVFGVREIEVIRPSDWTMFSPLRQQLLLHLGYPAGCNSRTYLFHTHSVVAGSQIELAELDVALRFRWDHQRQVQMQHLMARRDVMESLRRITSYNYKARFTRDLGDDRREWLDDDEIAELAQFTHTASRGWQSFRFTIGV